MSTTSASSAEERLANLIINRHNLKPGFDVKKLLSTFADLRFGKIPGNVDGISINLKSPDKKTVVIISEKIPPVRQKFTMAHELGHIVIPWHIGTIVSHTDENHGYTNRLYHDCEAEANRFAAELLMPSQWVTSILEKTHPGLALEIITSIAGTSALSAFYKIGSNLPSKYIGIHTNLHDEVISSVSTNSRLRPPLHGSPITQQAIYKNASAIKISTLNNSKIYWLTYSKIASQPASKDLRTWREILYPILDELSLDRKVGAQISGCLAYINKPDVMHTEFLEKAIERIASDNLFYEVSKHKDFEIFLIKKIDELIKNRKK